jgi:hypothetical protein
MSAAQMAVLTADRKAVQTVGSRAHLWDCLLAAMSAAQMAVLTADRKAVQTVGPRALLKALLWAGQKVVH